MVGIIVYFDVRCKCAVCIVVRLYCVHGSSCLVHVVILCELSSVCVVSLCVRALLTILMFYLDAGLLASSQYLECPVTGHLDTGFFLGFPVSSSKC
jgi:hypothetical protein